MATTKVAFGYLKEDPKWATEKPFIFESNITYDEPAITNTEKEFHSVSLTDIRGQENNYTYESHGFRYIKHPSKIDQLNIQQHDALGYMKETMDLLCAEFNAERVICYDVRVRTSSLMKPRCTQ